MQNFRSLVRLSPGPRVMVPAMELDDLPKKPKKPYEPLVLEGWSATDLELYLGHLQAEALRVTATLDAKQGIRGAAEAIFKR